MLDDLKKVSESAQNQSKIVKECVNAQTQSVDSTKGKFSDIVDAIEKVNDAIKQITEGNELVTSNFFEVSDLVNSLSAAAEENAASSEEIAATTDNIKLSVNSVYECSLEIEKEADTLADEVSHFKLSNHS